MCNVEYDMRDGSYRCSDDDGYSADVDNGLVVRIPSSTVDAVRSAVGCHLDTLRSMGQERHGSSGWYWAYPDGSEDRVQDLMWAIDDEVLTRDSN